MPTLRAKTPDTKVKRLKLMAFGPPAIGKTTAAIQFPKNYIIDMERGTDNYGGVIKASGSVVFQTTNADEVKAEIKALLTEKHDFRTVTIDPATILYGAVQEKWTRIFEKWTDSEKTSELQDFGFRYWGRVKSEYKSIMRMLLALDMNVILLSHQKDIYGDGMKKVGLGSDSMRGDEYIFDYIFQLSMDPSGKRMAVTRKERAEIGKQKFPANFEWSYQNFVKFYGQDALEREAKPLELATPEQVLEINRLLGIVKIDDTWATDCLDKADVDSWEEMTAEKIQKAIDYLTKKLSGGK